MKAIQGFQVLTVMKCVGSIPCAKIFLLNHREVLVLLKTNNFFAPQPLELYSKYNNC